MNMELVDNLYEQIKQTKEELNQAWQNFDYAEKDMIDVAILDVRVKQLKYERLAKKLHKAVFPQKKERWSKWIFIK